MRPYEVMVIFDAELEPDDVRAAVDRHVKSLRGFDRRLPVVRRRR